MLSSPGPLEGPDPIAGAVVTAGRRPAKEVPVSDETALEISWDRERRGRPEVRSATGGLLPVPQGTACLASWGRLIDPAALARRARAPFDAPLGSVLGLRYRQVGFRLADEIEGSLCAVLWDEERQSLVALRDRTGLGAGVCWAIEGGRLLLALSASRLARSLDRPVRPDSTSVLLHLHGHGLLPGHTFHDGVSEVPPGSWLVAGARAVEVREYWSVDAEIADEDRDEREVADELRELLLEIGRDWGSSRPAAVSLSGGMDSPSIAAAVRRAAPEGRLLAIHHTTAPLEACGESGLAREVARHLGLRMRSFDGTERWPLRDADGPLTGPDSPYRPTYAEVWEETFRIAAAEGAPVLLTGAGGDHLFAGPRAYEYPDLLSAGRWRELVTRWRRHPEPRPSGRQVVSATLHAALPDELVASRYRVDWLARSRRGEWARAFAALQPSPRAPSRRELTFALRDGMVPIAARTLEDMARPHGVELRHPYFDRRLIELAARLPTGLAAANGLRKRILREAVRPWLPAALVERREKIMPVEIIDRGLRERETRRVWELLTGMRAAEAGWVDEERARRGYWEYLAGRGDLRLWHAVTLESWLRHWF